VWNPVPPVEDDPEHDDDASFDITEVGCVIEVTGR
jgi:hypothetical protein